jgi:predicted regulator of Ras-like GTPase activity (Roadblock/LC7/MglB family)
MTKLDQLLQQLRAELGPEFVSTFVVGDDGLSIASISTNDGDKDGSNSARVAMVLKLAQKVSEKLNLGELQENLV